jgi:hypothetical protein
VRARTGHVLEIDFLKRALQHVEQQRQLRAASGGAPFTNALSEGMADPVRARMTRSLHWARETTFTSDDILATHTRNSPSHPLEQSRTYRKTCASRVTLVTVATGTMFDSC